MEGLNELIQYRLQRANESLEEAKLLSQANHWNTVANRLYYACFYAVGALFAKSKVKNSSHSWIKILFNKEFIKSGLLNKKLGKLYNDLFNKRGEGDYRDFKIFEGNIILPYIQEVEDFIKEIEIQIYKDE